MHDAQAQLARAQHRLSVGMKGQFADARLARSDVSGVWRDVTHLGSGDGALAHFPLVIEVELSGVDDVQIANAALVHLDLLKTK